MTIRRDWLKRQVEAGRMDCRCDCVEGYMNMMGHEFTGNCGHVYANSKAGPFTLHVHSNLCYTLRFKQATEVAAC